MKKPTRFAALSLLTLLAGACGGTEQPPEEIEYCEHMAEGPAVTLAATADGEGAMVAADHQRYDLTLTSEARSVKFAVGEAGDFRFAVDRNIVLIVTDPSGRDIQFDDVESDASGCSEVAFVYTGALPVGTSTLTFGGTDTSVSVVVEHAAHADE